ncbi:RadC DNA repair proteins [uncultured Caudovirales phage]|uniref:RadC DNA repair proteins n=1 Tax=uncultured Caudovirales phage TaxID=2100421 RepID=A0A6J5NSH0_9CAUD|nr:RadC DNA repair proteins [uncultured Caudovirales phage]
MKSTLNEPSVKSARVVVSTLRAKVAFYGAIDSSENLARFWRDVVAQEADHETDRESLVVVCLDSRLKPFSWARVSLGSSNQTTAEIRDILRPVLVTGATGFAMLHNHPSGDVSPSRADISVTRKVQEAAMLMGLNFADHVIVSDTEPGPDQPSIFSLREHGMI